MSALDVFSRARRPPHHLDVRTGVFAGLTTYANWPYVHSSFIPCLSCAMSFYSVSFVNEGIEECVEGIRASGHQRAG